MSVAICIIPCLDAKDGQVVKGINSQGLRDAGNPAELTSRYCAQGTGEITFLNISVSHKRYSTTLDMVCQTAEQIFVPLTVGGGVHSLDDVDLLLKAGADKVSINTAAIEAPSLLTKIAWRFGNQVLVLSVGARRCPSGVSTASGFEVITHGGRASVGIDAVAWATRGVKLGTGETPLNSTDADRVTQGFDTELIDAVRRQVQVPLIVSGGIGRPQDFTTAADHGADGVLAASVFHYGMTTIPEAKSALRGAGHPVR